MYYVLLIDDVISLQFVEAQYCAFRRSCHCENGEALLDARRGTVTSNVSRYINMYY